MEFVLCDVLSFARGYYVVSVVCFIFVVSFCYLFGCFFQLLLLDKVSVPLFTEPLDKKLGKSSHPDLVVKIDDVRNER